MPGRRVDDSRKAFCPREMLLDVVSIYTATLLVEYTRVAMMKFQGRRKRIIEIR